MTHRRNSHARVIEVYAEKNRKISRYPGGIVIDIDRRSFFHTGDLDIFDMEIVRDYRYRLCDAG